MFKRLWSLPSKRIWGIRVWMGVLVMSLLWGGGEIIIYAEEQEPKQKTETAAPANKPLTMGAVKLVDVDNYTKMRILRTRGSRSIKLVIEDLPIQTFGMSHYEIVVDNNSSPEVQASLPEGRYPAKLYRRHKEYDEALNIRLNEVDDNSNPKALFIEIKPNAVTVVRCYLRDYSEIKYEVLMEE